MSSNIPEPVFIFFTELASRIHSDQLGVERKQVIHLLEQWREKNADAIFTSLSQKPNLERAIDLAIEITKNAFIPPWEHEK